MLSVTDKCVCIEEVGNFETINEAVCNGDSRSWERVASPAFAFASSVGTWGWSSSQFYRTRNQ